MISIILTALWFFLPAGMANTTPVFASKIPYLKKINYPLDFSYEFKGKRLLGKNKTIRGLFTGIFIGIVITTLQVFIYNKNYDFINNSLSINYSAINPIILGFLLSSGALIGDSIKSFFKRQFDIKSGETWFPFDQIDYVIGGLLFSLIYIKLEIEVYLAVTIIWFILHPLSTVAGYLLKLKDKPI